MKKRFLLLNFALFAAVTCLGQTRDADYDYILKHYLSDVDDSNYKMKSLTTSSMKKSNDITATIEFVNFSTKDNNANRGTAVVYKEKKKDNQIVNFTVLCIPEKNSSATIHNKAFDAINAITDLFILKYLISGMMKIGINKS